MVKFISGNSRKKNTILTLIQKQEICTYHQENPRLSQVELREKFNLKFKCNISKTAMSDLISDSEKWINIEATEKYRLRKANYPELEARLFLWFKDALKEKIPLCDDLVIEQAKLLVLN